MSTYTIDARMTGAGLFPTAPQRPPMLPSLLRGGLTGIKADTPTDEFLEAFCEAITREEWLALGALPPIKRVTELVVLVCQLRQLPAQIAPVALRRAQP